MVFVAAVAISNVPAVTSLRLNLTRAPSVERLQFGVSTDLVSCLDAVAQPLSYGNAISVQTWLVCLPRPCARMRCVLLVSEPFCDLLYHCLRHESVSLRQPAVKLAPKLLPRGRHRFKTDVWKLVGYAVYRVLSLFPQARRALVARRSAEKDGLAQLVLKLGVRSFDREEFSACAHLPIYLPDLPKPLV